MQLSRTNLQFIQTDLELSKPEAAVFDMPEKILQFGTGVLLRALPDYFFYKAIQRGDWKGRVVIVKSTDSDHQVFADQDQLYTIWERGLENGVPVERFQLNAAVSRVIAAREKWESVLEVAASPELELVVSNTTEIGLLYEAERLSASMPETFPAKLLAVLLTRYHAFNGDPGKGLVIIPTELIPDNGVLLKELVLRLARYNALEAGFLAWVEASCIFCNSLVDRIVTGMPSASIQEQFINHSGYEDRLLTCCEPFRLWAISGPPEVKARLPFASSDSGFVITEDLKPFIELKLRLLNGNHTFCSGLAYLCGLRLTRDAVAHPAFGQFMNDLLHEEIIPGIAYPLTDDQKKRYAVSVVERCANPYVDHPWINITFQYSSKMKVRNTPLFTHYINSRRAVPQRMACCFAAYIRFMDTRPDASGKYVGQYNGEEYSVNDEQAALFSAYWQTGDGDSVVSRVLRNTELWGMDLSELPGWEAAVAGYLRKICETSALDVLESAFGSAS